MDFTNIMSPTFYHTEYNFTIHLLQLHMVEVELIINLFEVNFRYIITMVEQTVNQCPLDRNTKYFFGME